MHRQLAHLYIVNTHYNDIHYYYNDIHYFNNPNISLIRPPSGPKLFGLVRVYCTEELSLITGPFPRAKPEGEERLSYDNTEVAMD